MQKNIVIVVSIALVAGVIGYKSLTTAPKSKPELKKSSSTIAQTDTTKKILPVTGTYVCLPLIDTAAKTADCAFGLKTDDGTYYAVNYESQAGYMDQFQAGKRISAKGYITLEENLRPNRWTKFMISGLLTITEKPTVE